MLLLVPTLTVWNFLFLLSVDRIHGKQQEQNCEPFVRFYNQPQELVLAVGKCQVTTLGTNEQSQPNSPSPKHAGWSYFALGSNKRDHFPKGKDLNVVFASPYSWKAQSLVWLKSTGRFKMVLQRSRRKHKRWVQNTQVTGDKPVRHVLSGFPTWGTWMFTFGVIKML